MTGWLGHQDPFAFDTDCRPADRIRRRVCPSPGILGLVAFEAALEVFEAADMSALRAKSVALCDLFIDLVEQECPSHGFALISPRDAGLVEPLRRGSQISFAHPEGHAIIRSLISRGVIGDFRDPDVMRFGFTPLYQSFIDVFDAVRHLRAVMERREWDDQSLKSRVATT